MRCNGRLESVIEGPVQPVVKRLIVGDHVELSIESQSALSMWLYKIAILFRYTETNPREASRDELDDLLVRVRPRSGTHIFVGSYGGSYHVRIAANQLGKLRVMQGRDAVQNLLKLIQKGRWEFQEHVTVAAGRFCAQVSLYPPRSTFTYGPSAALMRQIWPALGPVRLAAAVLAGRWRPGVAGGHHSDLAWSRATSIAVDTYRP